MSLTLSMRARSTRGNWAAFELHGRLNRAEHVIEALTGSGIVTQDDMDQI